jgi:hypothetical protein
MTSKTSGILYKPFGIVGGIVAGKIASAAFTKVWAQTRHDGTAPTPRSADATMGQAVLAAVLQGAIFTGTSAVFQRLSAGAFERWAGEWPDDRKPPKPAKESKPAKETKKSKAAKLPAATASEDGPVAGSQA